MNITLENLTKRFPARGRKAQGEVTAVEDLTFEIPDGMLVGLLGPSGCGKSTTLNMICGLETPTSGKIFFGEEDVTALAERLGLRLLERRPDGCDFKIEGDDMAKAFLNALVAAGIFPERFEIREPSLHEIFVEKVGAVQ